MDPLQIPRKYKFFASNAAGVHGHFTRLEDGTESSAGSELPGLVAPLAHPALA